MGLGSGSGVSSGDGRAAARMKGFGLAFVMIEGARPRGDGGWNGTFGTTVTGTVKANGLRWLLSRRR